jgi:hypothetical protein
MTGWEHGVNPTTSGGGLANALSGSPTVVTSPVHAGTYALRCNPAGAAQYMQKTVTGDRVVLRMYVRFDTLPSADCDLFTIRDAGGLSFRFKYIQASNKFQVVFGSTDPQLSSMTVSTGQWYCVELNVLLNAATRTCDWQIDGTAQTQSASTQTASTVAALRIGTGNAETYTCYYDDLIVSVTNADYPLGAGGVTGLSPNAEGTHSPGTNEIEDNAGDDINGSTVQAYPLMDNVPMNSTADYVQQATAHTVPDAHYAEVGFADIASGLTVKGVIGLLAYKSSATQANSGSTIAIRSDATQIEIYGTPAVPVDYSESSLFYKSAVITAPGGGWTQSEVNALLMRVGGSSDATPLPQWHALMFEVDTVTESTPKADSDTATESETSSLAVTANVTDATTESEAVSLEAVATAIDAAALAEGTPDVAQAVSDAATEGETAALEVGATTTDAAALDEATDISASATATDAGVESEAAALEATPNVTDAATGGEAADLAASAGVTDNLSLAEAAQAEAQASGADTFTLADTGSVQQSGGDQSLEAQDAFALAESAALAASATITDAITLGEAAALSAALAGVDAAMLGEGTPNVAQDVSDAATETETAALEASPTVTDALAFAETTQTEAQASGADTATLTDLGIVMGEGDIEGQDAFAMTEAAVVTVSVVVQDSFVVSEVVGVSASLAAQDVLAVAEGQGAIAQSVTDALTFGDVATLASALVLTDGFALAEASFIGVLAGVGDAFSLLELAMKTVIHIVPPLDADVIVGGTGASPRGALDTSASMETKQTGVALRGSGTTDVEVLT